MQELSEKKTNATIFDEIRSLMMLQFLNFFDYKTTSIEDCTKFNNMCFIFINPYLEKFIS